ncbi:MAG: hypothetical protein Q4E62_04770, partial [Sutterellaceae bacterium]|nr:hypothetical protein [Sutterellaceae bacterium]
MTKNFHLPQWRRTVSSLAGIFSSRKGFIGIASAMVLVPTATLVGGTFLYQRAITNSSAYTLATTQAALAAAKTSMKLQPMPDYFLTDAWIRENARSVTNSSEIVSISVTKPTAQEYRADVTYEAKPDYTGRIAQLFGRSSQSHNFADVEIFYRPLELVLSLDASNSQEYMIPETQQMVRDALEEVFFGNESSEDIRVSLLSYSETINLGVEYARKIANTESRKLQGAGTLCYVDGSQVAKTQSHYDTQ